VFETPWASAWMATFHSSALMRMPDKAAGKDCGHFEEDLRKAADTLRALG
jgi:uracil-DNA glycosylase